MQQLITKNLLKPRSLEPDQIFLFLLRLLLLFVFFTLLIELIPRSILHALTIVIVSFLRLLLPQGVFSGELGVID